jgi:hypothetical protein
MTIDRRMLLQATEASAPLTQTNFVTAVHAQPIGEKCRSRAATCHGRTGQGSERRHNG